MVKHHTDDERGNDDATDGVAADDAPPEGNAEPVDGNAESTGANGAPTGENETPTGRGATFEDVDTEGRTSRRTFVKAVGAAAALGGAGVFASNASAAGFTTDPSGEVTVNPGEYSWDGTYLDVGSGDALVGGGSAGDVVANIDSGTMHGAVAGRLENIVVRGSNPEAKSGMNLAPGATVDGFVWPEGGQRSEDRALYTPDGGNDRLTIRNSAWAGCVNNGAYVDKPPVTMENCAAINNNIAGVRVGHRDGTDTNETTYVRDTLIAVTADIENDDTNSSNARGLRLRAPANLVVENCWFVYLDVNGTADLIELHDGAAGSTVTIRNCAFYNDTDGDLVRDKSDGEMDVTIEDCTVSGSGSRTVEPDYDGNGVTEEEVAFPLPSEITGYACIDGVEGVGDGVGPWDGSASTDDGTEDSGTTEHTLVLHASPDNDGEIDISFTVDGEISFAAEAEPDTDTIVSNDDGTVTATSVGLNPDALDSYYFDGQVVDYSVPSGATVDVSVDGTTTTFAELVGEETDDGSDDSSDDSEQSGEASVVEVIARQSGGLNYEFVVDGSAELHETSEQITAGNGDDVTENGDGTVTVTGFTGNDGFGDAYLVDGTITSFSWDPEDYSFDVRVDGETVDPLTFGGDGSDDGSTDDGSTDDGSTDDGSTDGGSTDDGSTDGGSTDDGSTDGGSTDDGSTDGGLAHRIAVDGTVNEEVTRYTFTTTGEVERDAEESMVTQDGTPYDRLQDIAKDGKVIGLVGSGIDVYRFDGDLIALTVDGEAALSIERNV